MNDIKMHLENCYGIELLDDEFDLSNSNVLSVYARNGVMKTSLAKTFRKIQEGKQDEIKDEIFSKQGIANILIDGNMIKPEDVYVINSFETEYQSDITSLLVNSEIKEHLKGVLNTRDKFFKSLEKLSGLKIKKTQGGRNIYELEPELIKDFDFEENSFLINIKNLKNQKPEVFLPNIQYANIFDDSILKKIQSDEFQSKIKEFVVRSDEIYVTHNFLKKGSFTLPKLKDVNKTLKKDNYFTGENMLILNGNLDIKNVEELEEKIRLVENEIKEIPEFQAIEKLLSDSKGILLKDIIENNPEVIPLLAVEKLADLRKNLWLTYFTILQDQLNVLEQSFSKLSSEIDGVEIDDTPWKKALDIYKDRFSVPYEMKISNLKEAVIGESVPRVEFSFEKNDEIVNLDRNTLDEIGTLSQGEKRALYLLNIIFDIEQIKQNGSEKLFIIDDIADSFDYKNKYAIIEYLFDLAQSDHYVLIILTHNFDFFRSVSSRLGVNYNNRYFVENSDGKIKINRAIYQAKSPFEAWKARLNLKNVLALIPFVRNIIEYGVDRNKNIYNNYDSDYLFFTALLHEKDITDNIVFDDLKMLYKEYIGVERFLNDVDLTSTVIGKLYDVCDSITDSDTDLENKVLLSMAIRHKAEKYLIRKIAEYPNSLTWKTGRRRVVETGDSNAFFEHVKGGRNQTIELILGYRQFGEENIIQIMDKVNIVTPENIHLNSFMYEPILDMDITELKTLYQKVKDLGE